MEEQRKLYDKISESRNLDDIQEYVKKVLQIRNISKHTILQDMLVLVEEVGELAKAIRKEKANMLVDTNKLNSYDTVEHELADVFIVLNNLANKLNVNLYEAFLNKEKINIERKWDK